MLAMNSQRSFSPLECWDCRHALTQRPLEAGYTAGAQPGLRSLRRLLGGSILFLLLFVSLLYSEPFPVLPTLSWAGLENPCHIGNTFRDKEGLKLQAILPATPTEQRHCLDQRGTFLKLQRVSVSFTECVRTWTYGPWTVSAASKGDDPTNQFSTIWTQNHPEGAPWQLFQRQHQKLWLDLSATWMYSCKGQQSRVLVF